MRVIAGSAKRKVLYSSDKPEMQPTIDRVKEALFSKIQFELQNRRVIDLFAGSGQLGIEALSRGAAHCDFVDSSPDSLKAVKKNLAACSFESRSAVHAADAFTFIKSAPKADIIFLDPPFSQGILPLILPLCAEKCSENGLIYCESLTDEPLPQTAGDFAVCAAATYGKIKTTYYKHKNLMQESGKAAETEGFI